MITLYMRALPGTPVGGLVSPRLPSAIGEGQPHMAEQVMSPRSGQAAACPYARPSSRRSNSPGAPPPGLFPPIGGRELFNRPMVMVNEMIRVQRGDEEVTAQRTILEQQAEAEARAREERIVEQFLEAQARHEAELSQQARAAVQQHALEEKAYYEARFHHLEANLQHRQALRNHNLEEKAIGQSRRLHQQLEESEQHYRTTIQREAENYAANLQQELQYHVPSNAQSQSLLSAERDEFRKEYDVQVEKWSHYSEGITQKAEETLQGLTDEYNELGEELAVAQLHLLQREEWQQEGLPPQTQSEEGGMGREEIAEFFAALNQDEPQASPLTPAVQQDVLSSRHLSPTTLPSFGTRVPGNLSSDSSTHLRSARASRADRDTNLRSSHLHRSTPPICIAIRLRFVLQCFWENLGGCGHRDVPHFGVDIRDPKGSQVLEKTLYRKVCVDFLVSRVGS